MAHVREDGLKGLFWVRRDAVLQGGFGVKTGLWAMEYSHRPVGEKQGAVAGGLTSCLEDSRGRAGQLTDGKRAFVRLDLISRARGVVMSDPIDANFWPVRSFMRARSEAWMSKARALFRCRWSSPTHVPVPVRAAADRVILTRMHGQAMPLAFGYSVIRGGFSGLLPPAEVFLLLFCFDHHLRVSFRELSSLDRTVPRFSGDPRVCPPIVV